jgi:hypothetical protein
MVGQTISHYRIVSQLGAGGMGVVYQAEDLRLGRPVALKFVSSDLGHDPRAVQRLRVEARAASALNHANICTIYDIDEIDGHPFIVMELMKGRTLRDRLADGPLKIHQVLDFGIEVADALHAAHSEGIIHRDIKPGNIFVTDRNHVKILDFGLAKVTSLFESSRTTIDAGDRTAEGVTQGTVAYMSPEQASGEELDTRTDLFSLGVVLYECATGRLPFTGKTTALILSAVLNRSPAAPSMLNPDVPLRLQEVIKNCLEKDRELRYQSAADLRADLKRVRRDFESGQSASIDAVRPDAEPRPDSAVRTAAPRRALRTWGIAAAVVVSVIAAGSYLYWRASPPPVAPAAETQQAEPAPDPAVTSALTLAAASLDARNFRAALAYAEQVLARDPENAEAIKIREEARRTLARLDAALADARRHLAARDLRSAQRAIDVARSIDAGAPGVSEVVLHLAELTRARQPQNEAPRRSTASPPTPRENPPAVQAPASPPPVRTVEIPPPATQLPAQPKPQQPPPPAATPPSSATPPVVPPKTAAAPSPSSDTTAGQRQDTAAAAAAPEPDRSAQDRAAIERILATYARAIETKDVALYRSIKPNLSRDEEQRLRGGFQAVTSQRVNLTIVSFERRGDQAIVALRRRDTIQVDGRQQSSETDAVMTFQRAGREWTIVTIR